MAMTRIAPLLAAACLVLAGCGDHIRPPSPEELARFRAAGKSGPAVDMNRVLQAKITPGSYRVVSGDVLRVEMPKIPGSAAVRARGGRCSPGIQLPGGRQRGYCPADHRAARGAGHVAGGGRSGDCRAIPSTVCGILAAGLCERAGVPDAACLRCRSGDAAGNSRPAARSNDPGGGAAAGGGHYHPRGGGHPYQSNRSFGSRTSAAARAGSGREEGDDGWLGTLRFPRSRYCQHSNIPMPPHPNRPIHRPFYGRSSSRRARCGLPAGSGWNRRMAK